MKRPPELVLVDDELRKKVGVLGHWIEIKRGREQGGMKPFGLYIRDADNVLHGAAIDVFLSRHLVVHTNPQAGPSGQELDTDKRAIPIYITEIGQPLVFPGLPKTYVNGSPLVTWKSRFGMNATKASHIGIEAKSSGSCGVARAQSPAPTPAGSVLTLSPAFQQGNLEGACAIQVRLCLPANTHSGPSTCGS